MKKQIRFLLLLVGIASFVLWGCAPGKTKETGTKTEKDTTSPTTGVETKPAKDPIQKPDFTPRSLSRGPMTTIIRSVDYLDLETGSKTTLRNNEKKWDLMFCCGPTGKEYLRALNGVSWYELGVADFESI